MEAVGATFRIPLDAVGGFDPTTIREVRLVFDRTPSGLIYLDHVGIALGAARPHR